MYVNQAMVTDVKVCKPDSNLEEVSRLMWDNDCGAIPVINQRGKPIGIITDRDIAMSAMLNHKSLWEIQAGSVIKDQRLCSCNQDDKLEECLRKMDQNGVRRMPVVSEDGRLSGIVSMGDVIAFANKKTRSVKGDNAISYDAVMEMLKHVSAHHEQLKHPVAVT